MLKWDTVEGWFTDKECNAMQPFAVGKRCVEIGSYKGRSTLCLAEVATHVYAVDHFRADEGGQAEGEGTLGEFRKNTSKYPNITTCIGASLDVVKIFGDELVDLVFIDALHSFEAVKGDILAWWPKLCVGGHMFFHDYGGAYDEVKEAVDSCFNEVQGVASEHELAWVVKAEGVLNEQDD